MAQKAKYKLDLEDTTWQGKVWDIVLWAANFAYHHSLTIH